MANDLQRTSEWFSQRKNRITASMIGAILGLSPYMTREDAMRAMVRDALDAPREFTGNAATAWGTANEATAIADFEMDTGLDVEAAGFHGLEDWAGASPDGLIAGEIGLEQKCPYYIRNDRPPMFKTLGEQPHYYAQIQFSMYVLSRSFWYFSQWTPYDSTWELVKRDQSWLDTNIPRLRQFHAEFLAEVANNADEHLQPRRVTIDTPAAAKMVAEYDQLSEAIERATERRKDLLAEMTGMAGDRDALFGGRKLTRVQKEGSVSYAKALKALAPGADVEKWRGAASSYWKLS